MRVFCPNCGSDNEGPPGSRVTCRACAATFDVPREAAPVSQPVSSAPPQAPAAPGWNPPPMNQARPWVPPPRASAGSPVTNTLAIVSLVAGIVSCGCMCIGPIAGIVTGVLAQNQISASNGAQTGKGLAIAGLVLSILGGLLNVLWIIGAIAGANQ